MNEVQRGKFVTSTAITCDDDLSEESPPFVVDGIIHSTMTLIYGQTCSGKSTFAGALAVALANRETEFLGRKIIPGIHQVGIIAGDPGGASEYRRRIKDFLNPGAKVWVDSPIRPTRRETWAELQAIAERREYTFLVVDNLSSFVPGSLSDDQAVKAVYTEIEWFPRNGIPVLVVAHTSEKWTETGPSRLPMGSSLIRFGPRWWAHIFRSRGSATVEFDGNEGTPHRMVLTDPNGSPLFDVVEVSDELAARRARNDETRRRADQMRSYVLTDCQALNGQETAAKLHEKFGGAQSTHAGQLSRGSYGVKREGGCWIAL